MIRSPEGRLATLERGGGAVEGFGREPSSETEITPRVRGECGWAALRTWAACWASLSLFFFFKLEEDCSPS